KTLLTIYPDRFSGVNKLALALEIDCFAPSPVSKSNLAFRLAFVAFAGAVQKVGIFFEAELCNQSIGRNSSQSFRIDLLFPFALRGGQLILPLLYNFFGLLDRAIEVDQFRALFRCGNGHARQWIFDPCPVQPLLRHVMKESVKLVELLLRERIVL